ncbi:MAG: phosphatidylglycerophosphatase A [Leptospirales bacterium]|jgi:phosphatidylglycerophosphatase A
MKFRLAECIGTGFYSGYLPGAPGTWGTLVAVPIAWAMQFLAWPWRLAVVAVVIFIGTWAADVVCKTRAIKDPGYVVSDEIAGYLLGVACFALHWPVLVVGFLVFRFFDILKPYPLKYLERAPGGWGVMLDDLGAGVYTALVLIGLCFAAPDYFAPAFR